MVSFTSERHGPAGSPAQLREYNFEHFRARHMFADVWRTARGEVALPPGSAAPVVELESTDGERVAVPGQADRPLLVHIGNGT
ncbi:MAG: hypothetical protein L0H64_17950 [Pseudonocardia sp.]|nr:hypothetical protein [Pseudonocardia sp.]